MKTTTLQTAAKQFPIRGLDPAHLAGQEEAFDMCVDFLLGIEKTKGLNRRHSSYRLKHTVENPSRIVHIPTKQEAYGGYVYEGTFILAALACGFEMRQGGNGLSSTFNISERGLRRRAREVANERIALSNARPA